MYLLKGKEKKGRLAQVEKDKNPKNGNDGIESDIYQT